MFKMTRLSWIGNFALTLPLPTNNASSKTHLIKTSTFSCWILCLWWQLQITTFVITAHQVLYVCAHTNHKLQSKTLAFTAAELHVFVHWNPKLQTTTLVITAAEFCMAVCTLIINFTVKHLFLQLLSFVHLRTLKSLTSHEFNPFTALRASYNILGKIIPIWLFDVTQHLLEFRLWGHSHVEHLSPNEHFWLAKLLLETIRY